MPRTVQIGTDTLSLEDIQAVAIQGRRVELSREAKKKMEVSRATVDRALKNGKNTFYGINTGFGSLKNVRIPVEQLDQLQMNIIRSHSAGVGEPLPKEVVRGMMALRAHTLSLGHSGVRVQVVNQILSMLNANITPVIPCQGSVGASGDLAPLAHLALTLIGEGEVVFKGQKVKSKEALSSADIPLLSPKAKEGLSLLNGTQMMTSIGVLALLRAENALRHADIAAAMTLEALLGTPKAFDERVQKLRPHPGQALVAKNLRGLTEDSEIYESHRVCDRVQDAYSIRCVPQVHGAARDALSYVRSVLEREVISVTDNPILFTEGDTVVSAGNFHGQPVAIAMDTMALALTSVASISDRRTFRLLDSDLSDLPPGLSDRRGQDQNKPERRSLPAGLTTDAGVSSGMMMAQVTSASLVSECKVLSHPASVDSIPTWADQEDHVSMGAWAARKAERVVDALEKVIAIEILCAAQGLDFRKPLRPAKAVELALQTVRKSVSVIQKDRPLAPDIESAVTMIRDEKILSAVKQRMKEFG